MPNSSDKKNMIIAAAENLFRRYGYSKTSLEDIARDASLGKGTLYYYFGSKEDIFIEVVIRHSEKFYETFKQELEKESNFKARFTKAIRLPIKLVYEHAPILVDAVKNLSEQAMHQLCSFRESNRDKMEQIIKDVIEYGYQ
ncbi:MAG: TetR/AcrR family transcriptional regulator, partial [Candidatus Cloacimonadaceae bacterium]